jgi:hypothetical protein
MAANPPRDDGRKVNVKLIVVGLFVALLVAFALVNSVEVGGDWLVDTVGTDDLRDRDLGPTGHDFRYRAQPSRSRKY